MRGRLALATTLTVAAALLAVPVAAAQPSPSASPTSWPEPGAGADPAQPVKITSDKESIQLVREPLILIQEGVEKTKNASFTLSADVLFEFGKATLTSQAQRSIAAVAKKLKEAGVDGKVHVIGHTDNVGSKKQNMALSVQRAQAVKRGLQPRLTNTGITLIAEGRGETEPLVPNDSKAHRAQNRRVSIIYKSPDGGSGNEDDSTSIAAPEAQPAPPGFGPEAKQAVAATQKTLTIDGADYTVRVDVEEFDRRGSFIVLRMKTHLISVSGSDYFGYNRALFSGDTLNTDEIGVELYDRKAGRMLDIVVDGEGYCLCNYPDKDLYEGGSATSWFLMTAPKGKRKALDIYLPAFGVLRDVPLS